MFERNHNYAGLVDCHASLKDVFEDIIKLEGVGKRVIGTYYRVAFFGSLYKELDGVEFIYRTKPYTQLPEFCEYLQDTNSKIFGSKFELIRDSSKVDRSKLDPEKAYIQVTYVEPHLDAAEVEKRKTLFEQAKNLGNLHQLVR